MSSSLDATFKPTQFGLPSWIVDTKWLEGHLFASDVRIVQVGALDYYSRFHIPGALLVDFKELVTVREGVPGMREEVGALQGLFGRLGIDPKMRVVAYDASGGLDAARFIWSLSCLGHRAGAILDGGLAIWMQGNRLIESAIRETTGIDFVVEPTPLWEADRERVLAASNGSLDALLLDTRSLREYTGFVLRGPQGHIPGALHLNWTDTLVNPQMPLLKPKAELEALFAAVGVTDRAREVIVYCQTAHRAAQTWLVLRQLGFQSVRLYDGSIAEWGALGLPLVTGEKPR
ncbi:MAG: sulfurtransferase [Magnetococcus sp. DMHC-6]